MAPDLGGAHMPCDAGADVAILARHNTTGDNALKYIVLLGDGMADHPLDALN